ncbi:MAG: hypothetical protein GX367_02855 [Bacteroidales bacterium]|nr:hypothetical protein [Bacteroidales bacterium]
MLNQVMYYGGMIFAIVMFIVSVLIFIKLKIHKVVGDLTGITEKRAIKNLEQSSSGSKLNNSGKLSKQNGKSNNGAVSVTDLIKRTDKLIISEEELRNTEHITTKLESEETTVLNTVEKELGFDPNQTTVLSEAQAEPFFYLETDLMVINTNEVI